MSKWLTWTPNQNSDRQVIRTFQRTSKQITLGGPINVQLQEHEIKFLEYIRRALDVPGDMRLTIRDGSLIVSFWSHKFKSYVLLLPDGTNFHDIDKNLIPPRARILFEREALQATNDNTAQITKGLVK